ncbi:MAG: cupin domain-containing protein [Candidatus Omnitrophota bacterium]
MFIRKFEECEEFTAGDNSVLREFLHPDKQEINIRYSLAHAVVGPGKVSLPHKLTASEVYYIIRGEGIMHIGDESGTVVERCAIYIPPGAVQYIENTGKKDLEFICIVDPAWRAEYEEVTGFPR